MKKAPMGLVDDDVFEHHLLSLCGGLELCKPPRPSQLLVPAPSPLKGRQVGLVEVPALLARGAHRDALKRVSRVSRLSLREARHALVCGHDLPDSRLPPGPLQPLLHVGSGWRLEVGLGRTVGAQRDLVARPRMGGEVADLLRRNNRVAAAAVSAASGVDLECHVGHDG